MAAFKRTNSKVAKQFIKKTPVVLGLKFEIERTIVDYEQEAASCQCLFKR